MITDGGSNSGDAQKIKMVEDLSNTNLLLLEWLSLVVSYLGLLFQCKQPEIKSLFNYIRYHRTGSILF